MAELGRWWATCDLVAPWLFGLAAAVTLVLIFLPRSKRRGLALDLRYWAPRLKFGSKRLAVLALLSVAVTLLLAVGLAEPQATVEQGTALYGKPVVAVVDVSGSMGSKPKSYVGGVANRDLRNGYEKARDIFMDLIGRKPDVNFALLMYSTENYVARYFAYKNELFQDTVENRSEIEYISLGTRTADALALARRFLTENVSGPDKAIVLISDLNGDLPAMVATAEEMERDLSAGIQVYVIVITGDGQTPANGAGPAAGVAMVAMDDRAGIDGIVADLAAMSSTPLRREASVRQESLVPLVAIPALGLILIVLGLTETRFRKIP
jgi:hypothetical protein